MEDALRDDVDDIKIESQYAKYNSGLEKDLSEEKGRLAKVK
jgi:hypothetical protein